MKALYLVLKGMLWEVHGEGCAIFDQVPGRVFEEKKLTNCCAVGEACGGGTSVCVWMSSEGLELFL